MKVSVSLFALSFLAAFWGVSTPVSAEIPASIPGERPGSPPLWISAAEAIENGELRSDLFRPHDADAFMREVGSSPEVLAQIVDPPAAMTRALELRDCDTDVFIVRALPEELAFRSLLEDSSYAFQGTVVEKRYGFHRGHLRTLLEVAVERWLKQGKHSADESPSHVLVVYEGFRFEVNGDVVCHRSGYHSGEPTVGGRILSFAGSPEATGPLLFWPDQFQFFFERADGTVSVPVDDDDGLRLGWEFIAEQLGALQQPF